MASIALLRGARSKTDSSPRSSGSLFPIPCVLGFPKVQFAACVPIFSTSTWSMELDEQKSFLVFGLKLLFSPVCYLSSLFDKTELA